MNELIEETLDAKSENLPIARLVDKVKLPIAVAEQADVARRLRLARPKRRRDKVTGKAGEIFAGAVEL